MTSRVDLHVHSRFSNDPSEWILRRVGAAETYTDPRTVYDLCRRRVPGLLAPPVEPDVAEDLDLGTTLRNTMLAG